jgi:Skp family chaperone for outer membrane proteins
MKLTLMRSLTAVAVLASAAAVAQTDPAPSSAALPAAPSSASSSPSPVASTGGSTRIGTINIEAAIFASNEGQRDGDAVAKKLEPKQTELKTLNDELEGLKTQLKTQGDKMNDEAKGNLQRQIEQKQKGFERSQQDLQEEVRGQENEIAQRILKKMGPLIVKYASDNSFGLIIDTSTNNQWPNGPVLWQNPAIDITKPVVDAYNVQSGVAPPARPSGGAGATKPGTGAGTGATKPGTGAGTGRPATAPSTTKPPSTTPKQ